LLYHLSYALFSRTKETAHDRAPKSGACGLNKIMHARAV